MMSEGNPILTPETKLSLHPLTIRREDGQHIVGRVETGRFITLPEIGLHVLTPLQEGRSLGETEAWIHEQNGLKVDVRDFTLKLLALGFVRSIDGNVLESQGEMKITFPWLKPEHVRWLFSKPMNLAILLVYALAGLTLLSDGALIPRPVDFIWHSSMMVVMLGNAVWSLLSLAAHEMAHLAAARSLGIPGRIGLGTRLHYLVSHTDVSSLWAVPRRKRYRVYMAGIVWDLLVMAIALLLKAYAPLSDMGRGICSAIMLIGYLRLLWEFYFFIRTDIFFVLQDLLRCRDLYGDAGRYLGWIWWRIRSALAEQPSAVEHPGLSKVPENERRKVRVYAWIMFFGSASALGMFFFYGIPITVQFIQHSINSIRMGLTMGITKVAIDGAISLLITGGAQVLLLIMLYRNYGRKLVGYFKCRLRPSRGDVQAMES